MAVTKDEFKAVMGCFAAGVTVITSSDATGRHSGLTATAFTSLSMEPPLCLVCIDKRAGSHAAMTENKKFAVNLLNDAQEELSNRFASRREDKFDGVAWAPGGATGCPVFEEALASMECEVTSILPGGDHDIFVGEIKAVRVGEGKPLVYWKGAYGDVASRPKKW